MKYLKKIKLPRSRGYRTALILAVAGSFFAIVYVLPMIYVLPIDRVMVASVFVVILAILMLVDSRIQRSRQDAPPPARPPAQNRPAQPRPKAAPQQSATPPAARSAAPTAPTAAPQREQRPQVPPPARHPVPAAPPEPHPEDVKVHADHAEALVAVDIGEHKAPPAAVVEERKTAPSQGLHHNDWLQIIRTDYLDDFVQNGGSGVKFVIPDEESGDIVIRELRRAAEENGYFFASVDAANTRAHMVDELFFDIARQVDWDELAGDFLITTMKACQYLIPQGASHATLDEIAEANGLDLAEMRAIINNRLRERLTPYSEITDNFRRAMLRLCQAHLDPRDLGIGGSQAVMEWLRGDLKFLSEVKPAGIFEKIDRSNGRDMVSSLSHWLHLCGKSGLILHVDISRFLVDQREGHPDGTHYYNTASVLDGYELLRQFVDGIDQLQYCLIVVSAPPEFLTDEKRGVRRYDALYLRVWDEVHLGDAVNPFSALVRVSGQATPRPMREKQPVS